LINKQFDILFLNFIADKILKYDCDSLIFLNFFFITLLSIVVFACKQNSNKEYKADSFRFANTDDTRILGSWTMCSLENEGSFIQLNVCPTITFKEYGIGKVNNNEHFGWILKNGQIRVSNNFKETNPTFKDTVYQAIFELSNETMTLKIKKFDNSVVYYLGR